MNAIFPAYVKMPLVSLSIFFYSKKKKKKITFVCAYEKL
jgi:hypothetical protein